MLDVVQSLLLNACVSTGIVGYAVKYIDRKIAKGEAERQKKEQYLQRRSIANANVKRAQGKVIYWLARAVTHPPANGELDAAMKELKAAEEVYNNINLQIVADFDSQ